jgi:hypothetical protein
MLEGQDLPDRAAHRSAYNMSFLNFQRVQQSNDVQRHVAKVVRRLHG